MLEPIRVAFAGVHRQVDRRLANHNWAAAFDAIGRSRFVGVFDRGASTRTAFAACWAGVPRFDDFGAMLAEARPEILCIATRQTDHADQIEAACAAGIRGILCDKPLATSMAEVDRIVEVCRRSDVVLQFGLDRRWFPVYRAAEALLRSSALGEPRAVFATGLTNLINHGCHWYDRVLAFAGDPEVDWVTGWVDPLDGESADSRRRLDPPGSCHIRFANGVEGFVTPASYRAGFDMGFDVQCSRGRLVIASEGADVRAWRIDDAGGAPVAVDLPPPDDAPPWPALVADLLEGIAQGRQPIANVDVARRASEIGFAVHHSHREGGRRVAPDEIDRSLRIESFPWGNE